eukprot:1160474-Pelagomonas_calceolata.AAC.2
MGRLLLPGEPPAWPACPAAVPQPIWGQPGGACPGARRQAAPQPALPAAPQPPPAGGGAWPKGHQPLVRTVSPMQPVFRSAQHAGTPVLRVCFVLWLPQG